MISVGLTRMLIEHTSKHDAGQVGERSCRVEKSDYPIASRTPAAISSSVVSWLKCRR